VASVYQKRGTWYLRVRDAHGRWLCRASTAATKTEARKLAADMERRSERQRLGLEQPDLLAGGGTVDELMEWWIDKFLKKAGLCLLIPFSAETLGSILKCWARRSGRPRADSVANS
jgi:hypothetical protein